MNEKQITDLIERMRELGHIYSYQGAKNLIREYEKLNKPEKVKVPQCVADWIERSKQEKRNLRNALNNGGEKIRFWFLDQENFDLFARAWLDGYEVEEESKYRVKLKNTNDYLNETEVGFHFYNNWKNNKTFTRKELEYSDFNWVLDCPGIELEEVE